MNKIFDFLVENKIDLLFGLLGALTSFLSIYIIDFVKNKMHKQQKINIKVNKGASNIELKNINIENLKETIEKASREIQKKEALHNH